MSKTSVNVQGIKKGSEAHNKREKELDYVHKDLTPLNESYELCAIAERLAQKKAAYQTTTGQKMQKKATPIREGVIVISQETTMNQLKDFAAKCKEKWGIEAIQIYTHKDEGHKNEKGKWKPNLHAHIVFDWTEQNGKSIKLTPQDMAKMQTILADSLGMERGVSSEIQHLNSIQFKIEAETQKLEKLTKKVQGKESLVALESKLKEYEKKFIKQEEIINSLSDTNKTLDFKLREKAKHLIDQRYDIVEEIRNKLIDANADTLVGISRETEEIQAFDAQHYLDSLNQKNMDI